MTTLDGESQQVSIEDPTFIPPDWATDPAASIPVGYLPAQVGHPDRFILGDNDRRAVVLLDANFRQERVETFVSLAAGAWKAIVGKDCDRMTAEAIAKGWIECARKLTH